MERVGRYPSEVVEVGERKKKLYGGGGNGRGQIGKLVN